jgi:hypothetical protein
MFLRLLRQLERERGGFRGAQMYVITRKEVCSAFNIFLDQMSVLKF